MACDSWKGCISSTCQGTGICTLFWEASWRHGTHWSVPDGVNKNECPSGLCIWWGEWASWAEAHQEFSMPSHWIHDVLLLSLLLLNFSVQLWVSLYLQECCTYLQEYWEKSLCYLIIFYDSNHPGDTAGGVGLEKSMGGQKKILRRNL